MFSALAGLDFSGQPGIIDRMEQRLFDLKICFFHHFVYRRQSIRRVPVVGGEPPASLAVVQLARFQTKGEEMPHRFSSVVPLRMGGIIDTRRVETKRIGRSPGQVSGQDFKHGAFAAAMADRSGVIAENADHTR